VRRLLIWILFGVIAGSLPASADENVVQEFVGSGTTTTGMFKVHPRWEVRWNARTVVSVAVMAADGTIVAGGAGVLRGSLFVAAGGSYYLKVSDGTVPEPPSTPAPKPAPVPGFAPDTESTPPEEPTISWHLQIVELGDSVSSSQELTVYSPYFSMPDTAVISPSLVPVIPPKLTDDQARALVTIKGDNAQGLGFLVHTPDGFFVMTHLHLLAANPNIQILTNAGAPITITSLKGATDRDLAMFAIKDDHYSYLPMPADDSGITTGDVILVPLLGANTDPPPARAGKVTGISPERLDFDQSLGQDSDGAPAVQYKGGKVIAMVTAEKRVNVTVDLAKAWPGNPAPGSAGIIPDFGLRLSGVSSWETYDPNRFQAETAFLKQFHDTTRCLDSYLHGRHPPDGAPTNNNTKGPPDSRYYLTNPKLRDAQESYRQLASGADQGQQLEAANELLGDLQAVADTDYDNLQSMTDLYAYDQNWAREELAYRKALRKELDDMSDGLAKLDNIARSR
jgi:hypothetical protein